MTKGHYKVKLTTDQNGGINDFTDMVLNGNSSITDIRFGHHGQNISLERDYMSACWKPVYSGGIAFTNLPLNQGDKLTMEISGNGELRFAAVQIDPIFFSNLRKFYNTENIIRPICTRKLQTTFPEVVTITRGRKQDGDTLLMHSVTGRYKHFANVIRSKSVWIMTEIIYGTVSIEFIKMGRFKDYRFHQNTDVNIETAIETDVMKNDFISRLFYNPTKISLINPNPWTSTSLSRPINRGEIITFECQPITKGRRRPKIYSLKICVSEFKPDMSKLGNSGVSNYYLAKEWTNEQCYGHIQLSISHSGHLVLINHQGDWLSEFVRKRKALVTFELFKVRVKILLSKFAD